MPEYNSDDSDDENSKPVEKPLFPSSSNSYPSNNHPIKTIEFSNDIDNDEISSQIQQTNSPNKSDHKIETKNKEKPSFASIITGGRSPQHETVDIKQFIDQELELDEASHRPTNATSETELSQKTFQRKRRIEFNVSGVPTKRSSQTDESNSMEPGKDTVNSIANLKAKYSNFQKGDTAFVEKQSTNIEPAIDSTTISINNHDKNTDANTKFNAEMDELKNEQQLLEAKLNFLCQGRTDVSPVQVIQIQLQVSHYNKNKFNNKF